MTRRPLAVGFTLGSVALALGACNAILSIHDISAPMDASDDTSLSAPTTDASIDHAASPPADAGTDAATDASNGPDDAQVDAGPSCMAFDADACALLSQCGCGPNLECAYDLNQSTGTACVPVGTALEHETCDPPECAPGLQCLDGMCHHFCVEGDGGCAGDPYPSVCASTAWSSLGICAFDCDLADPLACGDASYPGVGPMACTYMNPGVTDCFYRMENSPCASEGDCPPGKTCLPSGSCASWCKLDAGSSGCGAGTSCHPLAAPVVVATGSYGACR